QHRELQVHKLFQNVLLTLITVFLGAVVAKLYMPQAQHFGPRLGTVSRGDLQDARKRGDKDQVQDLRAQLTAVWIDGGQVEAEITDAVQVEIEETNKLTLSDIERLRGAASDR